MRCERLPAEFSLGCRERCDNGGVPVNTNSCVIGFHQFVGQSARLNHVQEARLIDYAAIRIDDNPLISTPAGQLSAKVGKI
jgi:hypothetical protein